MSRWSLLAALTIAACGGDDSAPPATEQGAATASNTCTEGTMSMPGSADDPCGPSQSVCAQQLPGSKAITMCVRGSWSACMCVPGPTSNLCGNGQIDGSESCDGANLNGQSCMTLAPGSTGMLTCNAMCKFDMTMCLTSTGANGGTGAPVGGTGAGATAPTGGTGS